MISSSLPKNLRPAEIEAFIDFAHKHGHIPNIDYLRAGVGRAHALLRAFDGDTLVGVAAIKKPLRTYTENNFHKAGVDCAAGFSIELGYLAVPKANKGVGQGLVAAALKDVGGLPIYATSRSKNKVMRHILEKFGFSQVGNSYRFEEGEELYLYVRRLDIGNS